MSASSASLMEEGGHDVATVYSQQLCGTSDAHLAVVCRDESRILITLDLDFANIAAYPPHEYAGFIVLRPLSQSVPLVHTLLKKLLMILGTESPYGSLWILEPDRIRINKQQDIGQE